MSRGACRRDSSRGRGHIEDSGRVSDRILGGGIEGAFVGLVRVVARFLEGTLGSSDLRAFLLCFSCARARQSIQVLQILLLRLEGSARKEESRSFWTQLEQYFEAIKGSGRELGEKSKNMLETRT